VYRPESHECKRLLSRHGQGSSSAKVKPERTEATKGQPAAGARTPDRSPAGVQWSCHKCTLLNGVNHSACQLCNTPRKQAPDWTHKPWPSSREDRDDGYSGNGHSGNNGSNGGGRWGSGGGNSPNTSGGKKRDVAQSGGQSSGARGQGRSLSASMSSSGPADAPPGSPALSTPSSSTEELEVIEASPASSCGGQVGPRDTLAWPPSLR
jgi:hypothetical protein